MNAPKSTAAKSTTPKLTGAELLRLVDVMHREKNIPKEVIFTGIEASLQMAAQRSAGEDEDVIVHIDRGSGQIIAQRGDQAIDPEHLGRIAAQAAKQVMIQKIREAESDGVFTEFATKKGEMVTGTIQRLDAGTAIVSLSKDGKNASGTVESLLPRSEQIPGETHHVNDRIKAVVMDVRRNGHRVKIVLSRNHPDFVRSLFEQEIPEIADHTISVKAVSREAGYRSKVAVSSIDPKVDCVGACVGVRGSRIKNVIDELNGERIDIVRWNDSVQVMITNALQPADITEVMLYPRLGRAVVLVAEDQLSLAIGRRGQNVRLASKLVGWDIEIMTHDELGESVEKAERWFNHIPGMTPELVELLITEGHLSYVDLSFLDAATLGEMAGVSEEDADDMIQFAEEMAERVEREGEENVLNEISPQPLAEENVEAVMDESASLEQQPEGEGEISAEFLDQEQPLEENSADIPTEVEAVEPEPMAEIPVSESFDSLFTKEEPQTQHEVHKDEESTKPDHDEQIP